MHFIVTVIVLESGRFRAIMAVLMFLACFLLIFSFPFVVWEYVVAKDNINVVIAVFSMFAWAFACLLSGIIWYAVVPLREYLIFGAIIAVILQEVTRILVYEVLLRAQGGLEKLHKRDGGKTPILTPESPEPNAAKATTHPPTKKLLERRVEGIVVGTGFGMMSGMMNGVNVLLAATCRGTVGLPQHFNLIDAGFGDPYFLLVSSMQIGLMCILHVIWNGSLYYTMDNRPNAHRHTHKARIAIIFLLHTIYVILTVVLNSNGLSRVCIGLCILIVLAAAIEQYYFQIITPKAKMKEQGGMRKKPTPPAQKP